MKPPRASALALAAGLVAAACGEVSSPVPQPVPGLVRLSTPAPKQEQTLVVGLKGAVSGSGRVHLLDRASGTRVSADSTVEGTFSLVIRAGLGSPLEAQFENEQGLSEPVSLSPRSRSYGPGLGPARQEVVSPPDGQGSVTVSNDPGSGKPPLMAASPNMTVVVSNARTAEVATAQTDKDGLFSTRIGGAKGDTIQIMLVDPADPSSSSDFVSIAVP